MQAQKRRTIYFIAFMGLMTALCFVSNYLQIQIPAIGSLKTRIHFGNVFCLLSGLLLGGLNGGLAAGLGAFLFDLLDPQFISGAPITFVFKFAMAAVCAAVAYHGGRKGKNNRWNLIGAVCGSLTYSVLYLAKNFITDLWIQRLEMNVVMINLWTKMGTTLVNGLLAVVIAVPLCAALRKALDSAHLSEKLLP